MNGATEEGGDWYAQLSHHAGVRRAGRGKAEAREVLSEALASRLGDPEQYLDFESVRGIVSESPKLSPR